MGTALEAAQIADGEDAGEKKTGPTRHKGRTVTVSPALIQITGHVVHKGVRFKKAAATSRGHEMCIRFAAAAEEEDEDGKHPYL